MMTEGEGKEGRDKAEISILYSQGFNNASLGRAKGQGEKPRVITGNKTVWKIKSKYIRAVTA
jgi:hypothetical protein